MIDRRRGQGIRTWRLGAGIALAVAAAAAGAHAQTPPAATGGAAAPAAAPAARKGPPAAVTFYGSPTSPISGGVAIPAGAAFVWTSGTVPPVAKADAPAGDIARFGDTKTQAAGVLKAIETQLAGARPDDGRRGLPARLPRRRSRQGRDRYRRLERGLPGGVRHGRQPDQAGPLDGRRLGARQPALADRRSRPSRSIRRRSPTCATTPESCRPPDLAACMGTSLLEEAPWQAIGCRDAMCSAG